MDSWIVILGKRLRKGRMPGKLVLPGIYYEKVLINLSTSYLLLCYLMLLVYVKEMSKE